MEQPEEFVEEFVEESSDEEVQVVLPVVQVDPLNVEVAGMPDNPESPSPQPDSPQPSPASSGGSPQHSPLVGGPPMPPPPSSPREDSASFMNFIHTRIWQNSNSGRWAQGLPGGTRRLA